MKWFPVWWWRVERYWIWFWTGACLTISGEMSVYSGVDEFGAQERARCMYPHDVDDGCKKGRAWICPNSMLLINRKFFQFFKNWSIADLQCYANFCCTAKWFSYICIHTFFFILFSIMIYPRKLDVGPHCLSILFIYLFIYYLMNFIAFIRVQQSSQPNFTGFPSQTLSTSPHSPTCLIWKP